MIEPDDVALRHARNVLLNIFSSEFSSEPANDNRTEGFHIDEVSAGLLLSRGKHAIGIITRSGAGFVFINSGYAEPTFTCTTSDELLDHLTQTVATLLQPKS